MKKFALVGNPNCGKTTLFNSLTGSTAYVGNWPGVTVEKREGIYKKGKEKVSIVDLPGIYSLSPYTNEEIISRDFILDEHPDCIINIVDATNLERNLYLSMQLLEMNVPIIIALNMMDVIEKNGDTIDISELEKRIGVPVIAISALKENNLNVLMDKAIDTSKELRNGWSSLEKTKIKPLIDILTSLYEKEGIENPLFHAIKLSENDDIEVKNFAKFVPEVNKFKEHFSDELFGNDFEALIADARYKFITENYSPVLKKAVINKGGKVVEKLSISDKIDRIVTHKYFGFLIFILILFFIFHLTFSEDLFFLGAFGVKFSNNFAGTAYEGLFWTEGGINSPGVFFANLLNSTTGLINTSIVSAMEGASVANWAVSLVGEGILGGIFAVLGFLPQILLLFLRFSILEDSGYMARVAFILDRLLRNFGVSGRAFMPMIMGFGCSVPAMINTRTLSDDKERIATIRVIPFFSCGAKLPILTAVAGGMISAFGVGNADLITLGLYFLGMIVAIVSLILMKSTTLRGEIPPFIMELPAYHAPQFKALMLHLRDKLKHFVKKAFTIIFASTVIIWFLSHFTWQWTYVDEDISTSIIASIGQLIQPLFTPLGFGYQLGAGGWVFAVAILTGLIAKENAISTIAVLAIAIGGSASLINGDDSGVEAIKYLVSATNIGIPGLISFAAFNMMTIPCFASVATAKAELKKGTLKWTIMFWILVSFIIGSIIYTIGTYWWTVFIWVACLILFGLGIYLFNRYRDGVLKLPWVKK